MAIPATTSRPDGSPAQPLDALDWLRARGVTVAAVLLIAIQLWLKAAMLAGSYFRQDDYQYLDRGLSSGLSWSYLMWMDAGHLLPVGWAIAWLQARIELYNWPVAVGVILALLAAASFAMLRMLRTLFGNRPAILIPLGIFLFSPLSLTASGWWAAALEMLPLEIAMFLAVDAHVRYLRTGKLRSAVIAAAALALGMAAMDKGAVVPLLLVALTVAFFVKRPLDIRRYWRAWAIYGAVLAGYAGVFFSRLSSSTVQPGDPGSVGHVFSLGATMLGSTLVPGAVGGPWSWMQSPGYAGASPPAVLQQLSWAVVLIFVAVTCAWRVRAWRAWAILLGWIVFADLLPLIIGRLGAYSASLLGAQTRYVTDATGVLALCVALATLPLAGEENVYRFRFDTLRRPVTAVTAVLLCAAAAGSVWSLSSLQSVSTVYTSLARSYLATGQIAVADAPPGTVIVDSPVPLAVMDPGLFWKHALTSQVLGPTVVRSQRLNWIRTLRGVYPVTPMMLDASGQLRPANVAGQFSWPAPKAKGGPYAGQRCWNVTAAGTSIPLLQPIYPYGWTIRVAYNGPGDVLTAGFGGQESSVTLTPGNHLAYLPVVGGGNAITLRVPGAADPLCVYGVTVGSVQPDETGQAIPALPIPG